MVVEIRFIRSARKHRIGKAHAMHVISTTEPTIIPANEESDERLIWSGEDDRGIELEIVAIQLPELVLVIHVMPANYRRRGSK